MDTDSLPLAQAISSLRGELIEAVEQAIGEKFRFSLESIELHMQVIATTTGGANASVGLWRVVTVGGKLDYSRAATHEVKLVLRPRLKSNADVLVGDDDVEWRPAQPPNGS